jgi:histidyl-tRNA synthetase
VDFYPEEKEVQNVIFSKLRDVSKRYDFSEVESPAFEDMGLLTAKSGEEIKTQIFNLEKKGSEEFGLRFDLTVPITRLFTEKQKELPKPVKWFGISRMWRYERPQAGRLREFYQLSIELFGSDKPEADAEIINLAIDCLLELGLTKDDFTVRINNRVVLEDFIKNLGIKDYEAVFRAVDKRSKISAEAFDEELKNAGLNDDQAGKIKEFLEIKDVNQIKEGSQGLDNLKQVLNLLESRKDLLELDLSTARGLVYYTGTVFEIFDKQGKFRALAGGGRYDNLVEVLGGQPCPATGFAIGYATLSLLLEEKGLIPKAELGPDYFIAIINEDVKKDALELVSELRKKYSVDFDLAARNLSNQIKFADSINAKKLIVVGPDEIASGKFKVKDLSSGKEEEKARAEL